MATILIVDDRPSNRKFLLTLLGYGGHRLLEAADGEQALLTARAERPDLVVTDILMPNMDGYELVRTMRAEEPLATTPVIFYTASYSAPQAEALARSCGVRKVLAKPSEPQAILEAVGEVLGTEPGVSPAAPLAAPSRPAEEALGVYLRELEEVKSRFEGLAARAGTASIKALSDEFTANVASMQRVTARLSALIEVGTEMISERDPARLVKLLFAAACDLIESDYAAVGMLDAAERSLAHVLTRGCDAALFAGPGGAGGVLGDLLAGRPVLRASRRGIEGLPAGHPRVADLLGVPVASAARVYGWMYFAGCRAAGGFTDEDVRVATAMARRLALLYENAVLYDEIQAHAARLHIEIGERSRAQSELERFRLALDSSADMIVISDRATMLHVDVNRTACELLGYTREELLAKGPADLLPLTREELERTYDAMIADPAQASGLRSYYVCKDGSHLPFESTRRVIRAGERWLMVAVSRDIRERLAAEEALRRSEAGLRRAQIMAKLAHVVTGPQGEFESWSATLPQLTGLAEAAVPRTTRGWIGLLHPEDAPRFRATAIAAGREGRRRSLAYRLRRADGEWIHVRQTMEPLDGGEAAPRWFNTIQDVTEQREAEERIRRLNRVYAVLSGINTLIVRAPGRQELFDGACRIAVEQGGFGIAWIGEIDAAGTEATPVAWAGVDADLGRQKIALQEGAGLFGRVLQERKPVFSNDLPSEPVAGRPRRAEAVRRGYRSLVVLPLVLNQAVVGVLALFAKEAGFFDEQELRLLEELAGDISFALDHMEKTARIDFLAYYDPLTGLANRALFLERLGQKLRDARAAGRRVAVWMGDVERFRMMNNAFGHAGGDALLKQLAARLGSAWGDAASARIGADLFAGATDEVQTESDAARLADRRLRDVFDTPFIIGDQEVRAAARIGIAMSPGDGTDAETLLRHAEAALKKAKAGGERYLFFSQDMTERTAEKLSLENRLRIALARDEFVLHYQPKVDAQTRAIVGVEGLIRWQSAELGLVPPGRFIPLLEETGLILEVGIWALSRAARDYRAWTHGGIAAPRIAVNVSPIQLRQRDFVEALAQAIAGDEEPGVDLEITESVIMHDIEANIAKLERARELGLAIAIDDFGTGYSSLAYLAKLPVNMLKIDRSFIVSMINDPNAMTLVQTMINLAQTLRLKVVAEGVETGEQASFLRLLRCDQMQGYLFSRPLPAEALLAFLSARIPG